MKVRNLERAIDFYTRFLGMHETERVGSQYAFLTSGPFHHEMALQQMGEDAPQPPAHGTGLYHVAFEVPDRRSFAAAYRALVEGGIAVAPVDHYISWAMYFDDPDGNGLEIYCDSRNMPDGRPLWRGENAPLTEATILAELDT